MADVLFKAFSSLVESHQNSDLASLGNGNFAFGSGAGATLDNTSGRLLWLFPLLQLGACSPVGAAHVSIFLVSSFDGSVWTDPQSAAAPPPGIPTTTMGVEMTAADAKIIRFTPLPLDPGHHKLLLGNFIGAAFNAAGNTLGYRLSTYAV
jgi:hypothetical protein